MTLTQADPLFRRIRQHAEKRLHFPFDATAADRLKALKDYMRLEREMLMRYHRKGDGGIRVAKARSVMLDVLLDKLFQFALQTYFRQHGPLPCEVALVALGGYGREEVCPFSDVDLMFLFPKRAKKIKMVKELQECLVNEILYPMWDLSLKVGYSTRTVEEAVEEAKVEDQSKNAMMESRLITGSEAVFQTFCKAFQRFLKRENPGPYIKGRLTDQTSRRQKYGGTVFVQEPDIKNGVGGLRDYQNILWMAQVKLGVASLEQLCRRGYLSEADRKALERAYDFLLSVRIELHFQSSRPSDLLDIEKQPKIAWALGYRQRDIFQRVEVFMRDYYRHAQAIFIASKHLEQRLALASLTGSTRIPFKAVIASRRRDLQRHHDGFIISDGKIGYEERGVFKREPIRLIRVFRYVQQFSVELELELRILIMESAKLLTPKIAYSDAGRRSFLAILQDRGHVYQALQPMHELGILTRVLPEFGGLNCLVQHEFYHRYTADIHTLLTIRVLDRIITGSAPSDQTYRQALRATADPPRLYLMLLLHDIGKAHGIKGHAKEGADMSEPILRRWGIDSHQRKEILWIIENHLEMARFWQRYDVDDPRTVAALAKRVGDAEMLRYLYVFTYCDTRGTSEGLWNSYKDALHQRLFANTLEVLDEDREALDRKHQDRIAMIYRDIIEKKLTDIPADQIEAHFNLLPERYFIHNSTEEIILHLRMINELLVTISESDSVGSLVPVVDWRDDPDEDLTVVNVVTWDRAGLFYKLAGALTVAGVNILSTKAISRNDHITIDTFYIVKPGGGVVDDKKAEGIFKALLDEALLKNKDLMPDIKAQARKHEKSLLLTRDTRLQAPIPPSVEVYHELSLRRTIVEVQTNDHIGLLYQLAKSIFDHGYDISFARIATERGVALDTFYIEKIDDHSQDTEDLLTLRESLSGIIADEKMLAAG